jgi:DinB family protein
MSVFTNSTTSAPEEIREYVAAVLGLLGQQDPIAVLRSTPDRLVAAIAGMPPAALRQPESDGKWSIVQVLQHLADSELVWAWRLRLTLAQDRPPLTGYDQDAWASRLHYADADPGQALDLFAVVRRANVAVLAAASPEDWQRVGVHAERGEQTVEQLFRLYAGHDLLHINQIARIRTAVTSAT